MRTSHTTLAATAIFLIVTSLVPAAAIATGVVGTAASAVNSSDGIVNGLPSVPSGSEVQVGVNANSDGTYAVFVDSDRDGTFDDGEPAVRTPASADLKIIRSGRDYALIDDKDHDGIVDNGETIALLPNDEDVDGDGDTNADEIAGGATTFAVLTGWLNPDINLGDSDGDSWTNSDEDCYDPANTFDGKTWFSDDQVPASTAGFDTDGDGLANEGCTDAADATHTLPGDTDDDNDGVLDPADNCPVDVNPLQTNTDNAADGGDVCDADDDNDNVADGADAFPLDATESVDTDGDNVGNNADANDDNDAFTDAEEGTAGSDPLNSASTPEVCDGVDNDLNEGVDEGFANTDGGAQADCVDLDDDGDSFSDIDETTAGSDSLNAASTPEACDGADNDLNDGVDEGYLDTNSDGEANCVDSDDDGDSFGDTAETNAGSDPLNAASTPEICDGLDNDLDASVDETFTNTDGDGQADCVDADDDNDTHTDTDEIAAGSNPTNGASTPEVCDGVDNDLNEGVDEGSPNTDGDSQANCVDSDDDGDGVADTVEDGAGSDSLNAASKPEVCDGADNDLNEGVDEGFPNTDGGSEADCVDTDDDGDGVADGSDWAPLNPAESADTDGDNVGNNADLNDDGDAFTDAEETAAGSDPLNAASTPEVCDGVDNDLNQGIDEGSPNTDGDGQADCVDSDDDGDGYSDALEGAHSTDPLLSSSKPVDTDGDGTPDSDAGAFVGDTDDDNDGLSDADEAVGGTTPTDADTDDDGANDAIDNCGLVANADQRNLDGDEFGNACDTDMDDDGLADAGADTDDDADGFEDGNERAARSNPRDERSTPVDVDGDGIPNSVDGPVPEEIVTGMV